MIQLKNIERSYKTAAGPIVGLTPHQSGNSAGRVRHLHGAVRGREVLAC